MFKFLISLLGNKEDRALRFKIKKILGITPLNITLYKVAFQYKAPNGEPFSNERLEFLGDAALSSIIGDYLFRKYPNSDEGFLTEIRSRLVNRETMGIVAKKMGIQHLLKGESSHTHSCGNALEALIGAVYLDRGYQKCYKAVIRIFFNYSDFDYIINTEKNFKSIAFEWANKNQREMEIKILEKFEVDNQIFFRAQLFVNSIPVCIGEAKAKKVAEQNAARKFIDLINNNKLESLDFDSENNIDLVSQDAKIIPENEQ